VLRQVCFSLPSLLSFERGLTNLCTQKLELKAHAAAITNTRCIRVVKGSYGTIAIK
jgi:hypothetical protein